MHSHFWPAVSALAHVYCPPLPPSQYQQFVVWFGFVTQPPLPAHVAVHVPIVVTHATANVPATPKILTPLLMFPAARSPSTDVNDVAA